MGNRVCVTEVRAIAKIVVGLGFNMEFRDGSRGFRDKVSKGRASEGRSTDQGMVLILRGMVRKFGSDEEKECAACWSGREEVERRKVDTILTVVVGCVCDTRVKCGEGPFVGKRSLRGKEIIMKWVDEKI